jgi:[ribosomal protein S5]-alanine N-acetyltransferase
VATPTINTNRLVLRQLEESDTEALHAVFSDKETMRWWGVAPCQTLAATEGYVAGLDEKYPGLSRWIITEQDNRALGWVSLREKNPGVANIGYILNSDFHGRGYAREAAIAIIEHGFGEMGWRRISAEVDPDNAASIKLLCSVGFTLEGHLRGEWETHIGVRDSLVFGLLSEEWFKRS